MECINLSIVIKKAEPCHFTKFERILRQSGATDIICMHENVSAKIAPEKFEVARVALTEAGAEFRKTAYSKVDGTIFKFRF